ncbi:MAG TPA: class I SAM-dependent methyltransferase [Chitinophagaceae bacterium]|nr:class I SAM-dependent methyltransferase [Chitinophagaceae bacterium]
MSERIYYKSCPVCGSADISNVLSVKDYTVSNEIFNIAQCHSCSLRFTQDVPDAVSILPYYRSEDYISHTNTSKGLINRLYQNIRKRTLVKKRKLIGKVCKIKSGNLLDIGSGTGSFLNEMKQHGWQITGLEPDPGARKIAKELYGIELFDEKKINDLSPATFDAITLWHVLEHVHDLSGYILNLKSLLKENGKLFIAVPNYTSLDAKIYKEYWAAYDAPRHLYHFSPLSLEKLIKKNDLKIVQYKPMWYDSFYISLLSSKYKNGKTKWLPALLNGLRSDIKAVSNVKKCSSVIYVVSK